MEVRQNVAIEAMAPVDTKRTNRRRIRWSFIVAGVAVAIAVVYLVVVNTRASAAYYMTIPQLDRCASCAGQTVRVAAPVAANSIQRDLATQTVSFTLQDGGARLPVTYRGVVPDVFRSGVTVVVEGRVQDGVFQATTLLAKCPSKFQSATPGATGQ